MFTEFGKLLRKIRIDQGMLLKDMADAFGVSSAYLSAVETGKKSVSDDLVDRAAQFLGFKRGSDEYNNLQDAASISRGEVSMSTKGMTPKHQETALAFARHFERLDAKELDHLLGLLRATKKPED